ncbi:MAG: hypothetical protein KBC34_14540 [Phenylobacterium sp.]|nr:hypothetical protein [Phenylobacterium sp.]
MKQRIPAAALAAIGVLFSVNDAWALNGVYYGFRADQLNNKVKADYYTFLPDGRALRGLPTEGLGRPLDWTYECRFAECGTYSQRAGQVVFRNTTSGADTVFSIDGEGVLRKPNGSQGYRRMHLMDGMRLSGAWGVFDPSASAPIVEISFDQAGRFRETGLLRYLAWAELGRDAASRSSKTVDRGQGAYAIRQGTLELIYDKGPRAYIMLAVGPGLTPSAAPRSIHLNGAILDRAP